jgi:hypothetical protein
MISCLSYDISILMRSQAGLPHLGSVLARVVRHAGHPMRRDDVHGRGGRGPGRTGIGHLDAADELALGLQVFDHGAEFPSR